MVTINSSMSLFICCVFLYVLTRLRLFFGTILVLFLLWHLGAHVRVHDPCTLNFNTSKTVKAFNLCPVCNRTDLRNTFVHHNSDPASTILSKIGANSRGK